METSIRKGNQGFAFTAADQAAGVWASSLGAGAVSTTAGAETAGASCLETALAGSEGPILAAFSRVTAACCTAACAVSINLEALGEGAPPALSAKLANIGCVERLSEGTGCPWNMPGAPLWPPNR